MRRIAVIFVVLVTLPLTMVDAQSSARDSDRCADLQYLAGVGDVCPTESGLFEVFAPDGRSLGFTHGTDPRCEGCDEGPMAIEAGSTTPHCVDGAAGTYFIRVIYARATDDTNRYSTMAPAIRNLVAQANALVDEAANATGARVNLRVKCASGTVVVENEVLPTAKASASFSTIVNDLQALGYDDPRQKYWIYYDDAGACNCAGTGHIYGDSSNSVNNYNNAGPGAAPMYAVSFDSNSVRTMLHELGHNLGAVQNGAPRSSGAGHCTDGRDTMCYNDGGPQSSACQPDFNCSGVCTVEVFDCNKDTYCHANPAAGSYLASNWQACHRQSRFLQYSANVAPVMSLLMCSPEPDYAGETVTCTFTATDTEDAGVYYTIAWGDGATSRFPTTGMVSPGTSRQATHVYASAGTRTIAVRATDGGSPPLTSADRTVSHVTAAANVAPVVSALSCSPASPREGDLITCSFSATDTNNVSYMVQWGDGSAAVRVPASGVVVASATQSSSHTYSRGGTFLVNVTASDDGRPPKAATTSQSLAVTDINNVPVITTFSCPTGIIVTGGTIVCTVAASDDSPGVRYSIQWGDGTTSAFPTTGYVPPGTSRTLNHTYSSAGNKTVTLSVTDDGAASGTAVDTRIVQVRDDVTGPTIRLDDPRPGNIYVGCELTVPWGVSRAVMVRQGCVRVTLTDASGVERAEVVRPSDGVVLATDDAAPYELEFQLPTRQLGVVYQIRAVDVLGNVRTAFFEFDSA